MGGTEVQTRLKKMESDWRVSRAQLRECLEVKPKASHRELATELKRSLNWVRKWRKRLAQAPPQDEQSPYCTGVGCAHRADAA